MCIIIENSSNANILSLFSAQTLKEVFDENPDGWGLIYKTDVLNCVKGFHFMHLILELTSLQARKIPLTALHLRKATHGSICEENSHPFDLFNDNRLFLMHNGCIDCYKSDEKKSDTRLLCEDLAKKQDELDCIFKVASAVNDVIDTGRALLVDYSNTVLCNEKSWINTKIGLRLSKESKALSKVIA